MKKKSINKGKQRVFISIYFQNGHTENRKKNDITIAFDSNDPLYEKCRQLGSSNIKRIINVDSYNELIKKAKKEERTLSNYIKYKLRKKLKFQGFK